MDCLRNLITVDWCGQDITLLPKSSQYLTINSLPGISFKQIVMLASDEQRNWEGVWDDVTTRAARRFVLDVRQQMNKRYKLLSAKESINLGYAVDTTATTSTANQYRGFTIELNSASDQYVSSNLQIISIDRISYYNAAANQAALVFRVFDLDTGVQIDTFTCDVISGWNQINYKKKFNTLSTDYPKRVFISFDGGVNSSPTLTLPYSLDYAYLGGSAVIRGATATVAATIKDTQLTTGTNVYGLSANITIGCSWEALICQNTELFETAFWYLCGIELMNERINSERLNQYTTINLAKAKELRSQYEVMYMGGVADGITHEGALVQAIDGIDMNLNDTCLECNDSILIKESVL